MRHLPSVLCALALAGTCLSQTAWQNAPQTPDPINGRPGPRTGHVMVALDANRLLIHGGQSTSGTLTSTITLEDTWIYDATTQTWSRMAVGPERSLHMGAYDSARNKVVIFGGQRSASFEGATYEYDVANNTWAGPIVTVGGAPAARPAGAFGYDPIGDRCLLQGGQKAAPLPNARGDTWQYKIDPVNGPTWTQLIVDAGAANAGGVAGDCGLRWVHRMVFDSTRNRMVLYGGSYNLGAGGLVLTDTWEWGCDPLAVGYNTWTEVVTANSPVNGNWYGLAYDSQRQRTVMFGGNIGAGGPNTPSTELQEFDGTNWSPRTPGGVAWQNMYAASCYLSGPGLTYSFSGSQLAGTARSAASLITPSALDVYGAVNPASVLSRGVGCATSVGIPAMDDSHLAWVAGDGSALGEYRSGVGNIPAGAACSFVIGALPISQPLDPIGMVGCTMLVDPASAFTFGGSADGTGFAGFSAPVPANLALVGARIHAQAVVLDPLVMNPLMLATSNAVRHTLGGL